MKRLDANEIKLGARLSGDEAVRVQKGRMARTGLALTEVAGADNECTGDFAPIRQ